MQLTLSHRCTDELCEMTEQCMEQVVPFREGGLKWRGRGAARVTLAHHTDAHFREMLATVGPDIGRHVRLVVLGLVVDRESSALIVEVDVFHSSWCARVDSHLPPKTRLFIKMDGPYMKALALVAEHGRIDATSRVTEEYAVVPWNIAEISAYGVVNVE